MKIHILLLLALLTIVSCKKEKTTANQTDVQVEQTEESKSDDTIVKLSPEKAKNCKEFVQQYEDWANEYLKMMDKYENNPNYLTLAQDIGGIVMKGSQLEMQWATDLRYCKSNPKFEKKIKTMADKVEKRAETFEVNMKK